MLGEAYQDMQFRRDAYPDYDNKLVYFRCKDGQSDRIATIIVVPPGSLVWSDFKLLVAETDEEVDTLYEQLHNSSSPAVTPRTQRVIRELCESYNEFGCPNIAVFDFESILTLDLRPLMSPNLVTEVSASRLRSARE
jgi:hypothetical protein